jgi:Fur family peroxide stress response transcriptional regulator
MKRVRVEEERLRERLDVCGGGHVTRQRVSVYRYLLNSRQHPTAEEVFRGVKGEVPRISLATVYKNLEALVSCGLALKVSCGEGPARYDRRTDHHYHSRCVGCEEMVDVEPVREEELAKWVRVPAGFEVVRYRVEILGHCPDCQEKEEKAPPADGKENPALPQGWAGVEEARGSL